MWSNETGRATKKRTKLQKLTRFSESGFLLCPDTDWHCERDVCTVNSAAMRLLPGLWVTLCSPHAHPYTCWSTSAHTRANRRGDKETRAETEMTCTRLNEGGLGVWRTPQTVSSPRWSLWLPLSPPRPLTAEVWISFQIRVRAQQKSCSSVPK